MKTTRIRTERPGGWAIGIGYEDGDFMIAVGPWLILVELW